MTRTPRTDKSAARRGGGGGGTGGGTGVARRPLPVSGGAGTLGVPLLLSSVPLRPRPHRGTGRPGCFFSVLHRRENETRLPPTRPAHVQRARQRNDVDAAAAALAAAVMLLPPRPKATLASACPPVRCWTERASPRHTHQERQPAAAGRSEPEKGPVVAAARLSVNTPPTSSPHNSQTHNSSTAQTSAARARPIPTARLIRRARTSAPRALFERPLPLSLSSLPAPRLPSLLRPR